MWDTSFAIPSLLIIIIIVGFYFSLPRLSLRLNQVFINLLIVESLVIVLDLVASAAANPGNPEFISEVLNVLYFIAFFARAFVMFYLTLTVYKRKPEDTPVVTWGWRLVLVAATLLALTSPVTGLIFGIDDLGYYNGPLYDVVYWVSYFFLFLSVMIMIIYKKNVSRRRYRYPMYAFNFSILVGLVVRWLFPHILLMDTFCLISILIVYLAFGNPEFYLESRGVIFNSIAFREYIEEHNGELSHKALGVVIHNYNEMRDIYGSRQADEGITLIGSYLNQTYKDYDIFYYKRGRYIILGDVDMDVNRVIESLKKRFTFPWKTQNAELYLQPGFAVLEVGERVSSADVLLGSIIDGLNKADRLGAAQIVTISDRELKANEDEVAIKRYLENAVERDNVEVYLQPLMDAQSGKIVGAEALCRIRDDEGNIIPPGKFISLAEENGKINELGTQTFEKTCEFISEYNVAGAGLQWINVNLSPVQFMKADLADRCEELIKKYNVDPGLIHLEITEESMIDDAFFQKQTTALRDKGFKFVLDDYGTGYSNLARLKKCPFINIKLDMSIVWDYYKEPDKLLPNLIQTFKEMDFSITAEGIEDEKMAAVMREIGCDYFQGYYYSKPISMIDFADKYLA